jgi:hypothetical protein
MCSTSGITPTHVMKRNVPAPKPSTCGRAVRRIQRERVEGTHQTELRFRDSVEQEAAKQRAKRRHCRDEKENDERVAIDARRS